MDKPNIIVVAAEDFPLVCYGVGAEEWNGHPRVFLRPRVGLRVVSCPYCGVVYRVEDKMPEHH